MIRLIYGGSASGKSSVAEQMAMDLSARESRYYIATMRVYGKEGMRRVKRHVELRQGKGFQTVECPRDISSCLESVRNPAESVILIECISNLAANEMFEAGQSADEVFRKAAGELEILCRRVKHAVIVTNNIFEDGIEYPRETDEYIRCLARINRFLARIADEVIEVIAGIPCRIQKAAIPARQTKESGGGLLRQENCMKGGSIMQLVIGGSYQGKKEYILEQLKSKGLSWYYMNENGPALDEIPNDTQAVVIDHLHLLIRKLGTEQDARVWLRQAIDRCAASGRELILISDEVGNGVVPLDPGDRSYREEVGRILCDLAKEAGSVRRIVCGIAQTIAAVYVPGEDVLQ